ncbi:hypothetical protein KEM48_000833 [Puccinia striiformis f. sp. tritici PST-130]|nr:hypothetical protein KEM48_000833 [Puccinia striiformis f. sp. tritici PST-130]
MQCYTSQQFAPHPVPIIYASAPILKPKPIRPTINTNVQPASFNRPLPQPKPLRRPSLLRASTLDGRSLTEIINAARRASLNEQPKRTTKSPISINEGYPSNPHSRRMSFDEPPPSLAIPIILIILTTITIIHDSPLMQVAMILTSQIRTLTISNISGLKFRQWLEWLFVCL